MIAYTVNEAWARLFVCIVGNEEQFYKAYPTTHPNRSDGSHLFYKWCTGEMPIGASGDYNRKRQTNPHDKDYVR